jgi:L-lactate dehydrogenase complex protein LldG
VPDGLPAGWAAAVPEPVADRRLSVGDLDAGGRRPHGCAVAIADTGTVVLSGGSGQGRRALSLLPDLHVCVVAADQVVGTVPEAFDRLAALGLTAAPLTLVSGPSATSDIEMSRVEGVHGPRRLEVVLVDAPATATAQPRSVLPRRRPV